MEQRANIKFCFKVGKSATETFEMIQRVYGSEAMSRKNVFKWYARFRDGRESIEDDPRQGASATVRVEENVQKVAEILRDDRCASTRLIEELTGIPKTTVHRILTENLDKKKICCHFVPHSLTDDQKHCRVEHCRDMKRSADEDADFLSCIVTGDETWCFQYEPLTKRQSSEWKGPESPKPKNVRMKKSRVKTLLTVFFDSKGIIHKEFAPDGQMVNAHCYLGVLTRLWSRIVRVRPEYRNQGTWCLLHDNAPAHKSKIVRQFLAEKGIVALDHPPYSPDLAPCDFWLFPKLKMAMKGRCFDTISDIQKATTTILQAIPIVDYQNCFEQFFQRFQLCIDSQGDYFE